MVGGGNAYHVLVPKSAKEYYPISEGHYHATVIVRNGGDYFTVSDSLRTPGLDELPALTDERLNAFQRLYKVASRLQTRIAKRAFRELRGRRELPSLWSSDNFPSQDVIVHARIPVNRA